MKRLLLLLCLLSFGFSYLQVSGNIIIDESNQPITLKGFAIENGIFSKWDDTKKEMIMVADAAETVWALTPEDITALKQMNINCIRYCINYEQFMPGNPKRTENLAVFNKQLNWFRNNNIYIIFNLHVPPGHTNIIRNTQDSIFEDGKTWQKFEDFWKYFLKEYKNDPIIAGWEFFNEPQIPRSMSDDIWHIRVNQFLEKMRTIDPNHIFFATHPFARVTERTTDGGHVVNYEFIPFNKYDDPNIVYVSHFYEPTNFTHQGFNEDMPAGVKYPLDAYEYREFVKNNDGAPTKKQKDGWTFFQTEPRTAPADADYGAPFLSAESGSGPTYFDNILIYELNPENITTELELPNISFKPELPAYPTKNGQLYDLNYYLHWTTYYTEKYERRRDDAQKPLFKYSTLFGFDDQYSVMINNEYQKIANWQTSPLQFCIKPKPGYKYLLTGWVKTENIKKAHLGISWFKGTPVKYGKNLLEEYIKTNYLPFIKQHNVPLMITEFGSIGIADINSRCRWTKDVVELFDKYKLHHTYWVYKQKHGWGMDFALIINDPYQLDKEYYRYIKLLRTLRKEYK